MKQGPKILFGCSTHRRPRYAIFALGLLLGSLGRNRTFVVHPRGKDIKIPTDLIGAKRITYSLDPAEDLTVTMAPVNNELRKIISKLGPR